MRASRWAAECVDAGVVDAARVLALRVASAARATASRAARDAFTIAHSLGASQTRTLLVDLMVAVARVEANALRECEPEAVQVAFCLLDAATWPREAAACAELVKLLVTSEASDFVSAVRRNSSSLPALPVPPRRGAGGAGGVAPRGATPLKPSRLTPAEEDRQWRYSVVAPRGVAILRAPEHPGHKTGVRLKNGIELIVDKRVDVAHYPSRPMMARLTGRAKKNPAPFTLTFLHLADGCVYVCASACAHLRFVCPPRVSTAASVHAVTPRPILPSLPLPPYTCDATMQPRLGVQPRRGAREGPNADGADWARSGGERG